MQKFTIVFIACMLKIILMNGQTHYVSPVFNYALGTNRIYYSTFNDVTKITMDTAYTEYTYISTDFSLGGGISYGLLYGFNFNENLAFEVMAHYFKSNEKNIKSFTRYELEQFSIYHININYHNSFQYRSFNLAPSLKISADRPYWNPYISFGLLLSYGKLTEQQNLTLNNNLPGYMPTERLEYTYVYAPRILLGFRESLGLEFTRYRLLNLFIEVQNVQMNYVPVSKECVALLYQGEDYMHDITKAESTINFVDFYRPKEQKSHHEGKELQRKFSMSSLSFNLGFKFYF